MSCLPLVVQRAACNTCMVVFGRAWVVHGQGCYYRAERERDEMDSHPGLIRGKIGKSWGRVDDTAKQCKHASQQTKKCIYSYLLQQTVHFLLQVGIHK